MMSLGQGTVLRSSLKQKIKMNISTKGGLVGAHGGLSVVLQSKHFIEAQGYTMERNKLYQHNNCTIIMKSIGNNQYQNEQNTSTCDNFYKNQIY